MEILGEKSRHSLQESLHLITAPAQVIWGKEDQVSVNHRDTVVEEEQKQICLRKGALPHTEPILFVAHWSEGPTLFFLKKNHRNKKKKVQKNICILHNPVEVLYLTDTLYSSSVITSNSYGRIGLKLKSGQALCWCIALLRQEKAIAPSSNRKLV